MDMDVLRLLPTRPRPTRDFANLSRVFGPALGGQIQPFVVGVLTLPLHPNLKETDVDAVCSALLETA